MFFHQVETGEVGTFKNLGVLAPCDVTVSFDRRQTGNLGPTVEMTNLAGSL